MVLRLFCFFDADNRGKEAKNSALTLKKRNKNEYPVRGAAKLNSSPKGKSGAKKGKIMSTLTTKETGLLKDLKTQEQLCIDKYTKYAAEAKSTELGKLFTSMAQTEREHLKTINEMMDGKVPVMPGTIGNSDNFNTGAYSYANEEDRKHDAFMCQDMLATEKHASSVYDVSVFEFACPENRRTLNHIQAEEQQHGEQLYKYMSSNNMYS